MFAANHAADYVYASTFTRKTKRNENMTAVIISCFHRVGAKARDVGRKHVKTKEEGWYTLLIKDLQTKPMRKPNENSHPGLNQTTYDTSSMPLIDIIVVTAFNSFQTGPVWCVIPCTLILDRRELNRRHLQQW